MDPQVAEFGDFRVGGVPQIDAGSKAHCQVVLGRPVNQIEVKVILESRRVQNLDGQLADLSTAVLKTRQLLPHIRSQRLLSPPLLVLQSRRLFPVAEQIAILEAFYAGPADRRGAILHYVVAVEIGQQIVATCDPSGLLVGYFLD